jgi:lysophospholipase L1-like esterase
MLMVTRRWFSAALLALLFTTLPSAVRAQSTELIAADATRYLALGDSIASGYKAMPATKGYPYLLYQRDAFDAMDHTLFTNAAVPGASSRDLLLYQVPQALIASADGGFLPDYITITIGGNDLLSILHFMQTHPDQAEVMQYANTVLTAYGQNLYMSVARLRQGRPTASIYVANQYSVPTIEALVPLAAPLVTALNNVIRQVVTSFPARTYLVDVHSALLNGSDLFLSEVAGASPFETHLTNAGHRAVARAFSDLIAQTR